MSSHPVRAPRLLRRLPGSILVLAVLSTLWVTAAAAAHAEYPVDYNFFSGIPYELRNPGGSLPGADDWSCRPSAAHPEPVVLVHGTGGGAQTNWGVYAPLLANEGYCVYSLTYGAYDLPWPLSAIGGMRPIEDSSAQLAELVDRVLAATGAAKVDLIAHSQGNLVGNYFVKRLGGSDKVDKFVAIAAPWLGTFGPVIDPAREFARRLGAEPAFDGVLGVSPCAACAQMTGSTDFLRSLNSDGVYDPDVTYTNIETRYDELVVPYTVALVPGPTTTNIVVQDGCASDYSEHAGIAGSDRAAAFALNALDPDDPHPVPCHFIPPLTG
ncbi:MULTISPECIES: triacylglycerol lipase [Nocardia]|uniref:esterase/lipase family protein n=1 Tax=Nocardia TaxID=1817 RepID=UPI0007EA39A6|nr:MULTISPECIES: alpha/beta fold hydrolase [Nocardia]MBF6271961.1 alpha/beta fold hydrolase [Nocardia nova]OBA42354.1 lipase [Nocardia sp. 852002-51101_SCH5132738]OBB45901.1 lipase [Nocardia sp. 852002-51244_SCH5132740]OBF67885.1 lipase [Mycobacterium sp. 852002-51759_SCH5129042]